jgi:hypothetical protein
MHIRKIVTKKVQCTFHHLMEGEGFFFLNCFIAILKKVRICSSCIWLCHIMFCNDYILLCDFFMFKVLGLGF